MAAFLVLAPAGANAQQQPIPFPFPNLMQGTPQEEAACAPDSAKFCKRFEPDPLQVLGCLQQNRTRISKACQTVLRNRGV
ncbi:cysteine rich repeat-containing protein [Pseudorhodoplanes sp.]|uniref:cysteine rich repeat-containing protein n=1 Tax=Pseudorhodoplanes sp. TaxID=1934341 RepID=UPI003D11807B